MKIGATKVVEVEAKTLKVSLKVSDCFDADLFDQHGEKLKDYSGYVPDFMPGGGGDYVELTIDLDTGKILNWVPPTREQLEKFVNGEDE